MKTTITLIVVTVLTLTNCQSNIKPTSNDVTIIGAMKRVMWEGQLNGQIHLDTIQNKKHLYGLGPLAYLRGEIVIIDGKAYKSTVSADSTMHVEETYALEAPFFGYANIPNWTKHPLPDSIQNITQLETYLDKITQNLPRPYMFKLQGKVEHATIHVVNLPEGSKVSSPAEAHQGQVNYTIANEASEILGFFSTEHKTIFTHHDTFLHMHLMTSDKQNMGHLDDVRFKEGTMTVYLPAQ